MLRFVKSLLARLRIRRLKRRSTRDRSPRSTVQLCHLLEEVGRSREAAAEARRGLAMFPHAHELEDALRRGFAKCSTARTNDRVAEANSGTDELRVAVQEYLDFAKIDEAVRAARALVSRRPNDPRALVLHGRVMLALYHRDHVSKDGKAALESLKRGADLAPESIEARRNLAAAYHAIGATSQALFHVLLALEIDPRDPESNRIYSDLGRLPFQRRAEKDLLWEAEINDQPLVEKRSRPTSQEYDELLRSGLDGLSELPGVRRAAVRHRGVAYVAAAGSRARSSSAGSDAFLASAEHLRKASSAWAKRSGMGGFEEAVLVIGEVAVIAVAAGGSVLAIETDADADVESLTERARDLLASWTASRYKNLEWVR
jgi:tetratricopeptide (TPR) repeat protein